MFIGQNKNVKAGQLIKKSAITRMAHQANWTKDESVW